MFLSYLFLYSILFYFSCATDFYTLLEIPKHATDREIRKAFKAKALQWHPDKNMDDSEAQAKFIKINKAYEVLKDQEMRKKYDLYGEDGLDESRSHGNQYHSWSYYHDNFGIYDDDPEIITLSSTDFRSSVDGSSDIWLINFYHPSCSHCHTLAPVWRKIAVELEGVVRIGAVNCDDTFDVCSMQGVRSYPSMMAYPGRVQYGGAKQKADILSFILKRVKQQHFFDLSGKNWRSVAQMCGKTWVVFKNEELLEEDYSLKKLKIGAILDGLVCFGEISCPSKSVLCNDDKHLSFISIIKNFSESFEDSISLSINDGSAQEISKQILGVLPQIEKMDEFEYKTMRQNLAIENERATYLVYFREENDDDNFELKKLPSLLPFLKLREVHCSALKEECSDLYLFKMPSFVLFKPGGGYEIYQGRLTPHDIAVFAREGTRSRFFQTLTPNEFPNVLQSGDPWFVDFYAPWCPPCMVLLPEFRRASNIVEDKVHFGSIDCTTHTHLCKKFNIRHYPTTILYNQSSPHEYHGKHSAHHIADFVKDTLNPAVVVLDDEMYYEKVSSKPEDHIWVVDFYAEWCHHCMEMAPEYRKFARLMVDEANIHVAQIDCAKHVQICRSEGVRGYPTVVAFLQGKNVKTARYTGSSRDAESFRAWTLSLLPTNVITLNDETFEQLLLRGSEPVLVDFYAPWCGPCQRFDPVFKEIARELEKSVGAAQVNCDSHSWLCSGSEIRKYPTVKLFLGTKRSGVVRQNAKGGILFSSFSKWDLIQEVKAALKELPEINHDEL